MLTGSGLPYRQESKPWRLEIGVVGGFVVAMVRVVEMLLFYIHKQNHVGRCDVVAG